MGSPGVAGFTLGEVASLAGGRLAGRAEPGARIAGVVLDSRQVGRGDLFVALVGEHADGRAFAAEALAAGAVAVLGTPPDPPADAGLDPAGSWILTPDPVAALGALAAAWLRRLPEVTVVGVTGSSGKTTTKDLLADILAPGGVDPRTGGGTVVAARGSYNNELGLPLTVLRATGATRTLVLEYSARGPGHIAHLTRLAPPHVAIVTNIGRAHLGEFGSQEAIAAAKSELVAGLAPGGVAVLCVDDPRLARLARQTEAAGTARVVRVGTGPDCDVRATDVLVGPDGRAGFSLSFPAEPPRRVRLRLVGGHQVSNALAAAAAAQVIGADPDVIAERLSSVEPASPWRMEVRRSPTGVTVVNDAYNSNPDSARAALETLGRLVPGPGGQRWAVLGEMAELGRETPRAHEELGHVAVDAGATRVVAVGSEARGVHAGAVAAGLPAPAATWVADPAGAIRVLTAAVAPGDIVLVKASRVAGLEAVARALLDPPTPGRPTPGRPTPGRPTPRPAPGTGRAT